MPVPELENFRQKYPDYGDMSDAELARRLAAKYPEYRDLPSKVAPEMTEQQFTQERQRSAIENPTFKAVAGATIPTLGTLGSFLIPGSGLVPTLGQMALSGGATALNQGLGFEEKDAAQIGISTAIPAAANLAVKAVKGGALAAGKLFAPAATKEAGVEAIAETAGASPTSIARLFTEPASRVAYAQARAAGPVPTAGIVTGLTDAITELNARSNKPQGAIKYLGNVVKKYTGQADATYDDLLKEAQDLKLAADEAIKNPRTRRALLDARQVMLGEMDKISPAAKKANALYAKEQATIEITKAMRTGNSGAKIRNMFEDDPSLIRALKLSDKDVEEVYSLADEISNMATSSIGFTNRAFNAIATPIGQAMATPAGRYMIRQSMKSSPNGKLTPAGLATVAQFMRAYTAQE